MSTKKSVTPAASASGAEADNDDGSVEREVSIEVDIVKASDEKQTLTGVVLQPEVVDGQGDIIGADVIEDTAHKYLARYNKATKLGLRHNSFKPSDFDLYESYIAPCDLVINSRTVKKGSWIMVVKVLSAKVWKAVKDGELTGFSIGGRARVKKLTSDGQ